MNNYTNIHSDRFIAQRSGLQGGDCSQVYSTKAELFSSPSPTRKTQRPTNQQTHQFSNNQHQQENKDTDLTASHQEDISKRAYQALLQNQVLGVRNAHLLNEISNNEDYCQNNGNYIGGNSPFNETYSSLQKQTNKSCLLSPTTSASSYANSNLSVNQNNNNKYSGDESNYCRSRMLMNQSKGKDYYNNYNTAECFDESPYKSKFNVLSFSSNTGNAGQATAATSINKSCQKAKQSCFSPYQTPSKEQPNSARNFNSVSTAPFDLYGSNTTTPTTINEADEREVKKTLNFIECMSLNGFDDSDSDHNMEKRERAQSFLSSDGGFVVEDLDSSTSQYNNTTVNNNDCEEFSENNQPAFQIPHSQTSQLPHESLFTYRQPFAGGFIEEEDECMSQLRVPQQRQIPTQPSRVLDAPNLQDDYYLNLLDWSSKNQLSIALGPIVYIYEPSTKKIVQMTDLSSVQDTVTSVAWSKSGLHLAIGTNAGLVQVWDTTIYKIIKEYPPGENSHNARVGALAWSEKYLTSGSRDGTIINRDLRSKKPFHSKLIGHKQEVCGLKWSPDSQQLASGGNDNRVYVWSPTKQSGPVWKFKGHQAAVKALAWSPTQKGLLVTGGGTADRTIRFWDTIHGKELFQLQTESQVCSLVFSETTNELVSTHGYSENAICVWNLKSMRKVTSLVGHTMRVLYTSISPDGSQIVTGAGDETLRFWDMFPAKEEEGKNRQILNFTGNVQIR